VLRIVEGCGCSKGCPTCLGAQASDPLGADDVPDRLRRDTIELLHSLREAVG
jgi:hypothetical protein